MRLVEVEDFGAIDADADDLLETCFQDHEAYTQAMAHKRWLILGRKGSGKTAIFKKVIRTRSHDFFSFGFNFSDYPWSHHHAQASVGVPEEHRFQQSWTYLILLSITKILLNQDNSQPWNEAAYEHLPSLERFVIDSYGSRDPDVTQIFSPVRKLRIEPHLSIAKGWAELGLNLEELPIDSLPKIFQEVNSNISEKVLACLNPAHQYFICFDELDRGFDPSKPDYATMLTGLLLAARLINNKSRERGANLSVLIFLRDDIFETLRFEDKNKITENSSIRVEWDTPRTNWTLRQLMESRLKASLSSPEVGWSDVFDESKEMPGRQAKYQYILDRTFRRPRDIIRFSNDILSSFKLRAKLNESAQFTNEDIIAAREPYSDYLISELDDEVPKHISNYDDLLEVLRTIGIKVFDRAKYIEVAQARLGASFTSSDPLAGLRDLFAFSIVAYQRTGGVGGGSEYIWRYLDTRARFDQDANTFTIHPGLIEALDLKRYTRTRSK